MQPGKSGRGLVALALATMLACGAARAQESLDAGKPPQKLFAEGCSSCHRSAKGLAKGRFRLTLYLYLQKHYASTASSAWALTSYLEQVDARRATVRATAAAAPPRPAPDWSPRYPLRPPAPVPTR
jgi:mono/diheme cytochrome c family protein